MYRRRIVLLAVVYALGLLGLVGRLVDLQIVRAEALRQEGESRRHRLVPVPPLRGRITDRTGKVLAEDRPRYDLHLVPAALVRVEGVRRLRSLLCDDLPPARLVQLHESEGRQRDELQRLAVQTLAQEPWIVHLAELLEKPPAEVAAVAVDAATGRQAGQEHELMQVRPAFEDVPLKAYLAIKQAQRNPFAEEPFTMLEPQIGAKRVYPGGTAMGHLTGYTGNLTRGEYEELRGRWSEDGTESEGSGVVMRDNRVFFALEDVDPNDGVDDAEVERQIIRLREYEHAGEIVRTSGYFTNETVGRNGLEQVYNQTLRGRHARRHLVLERPDPAGPRALVALGKPAEARRGEDIALTIDLGFQEKVREVLLQAVESRSPKGKWDIHWLASVPKSRRGAACVLMNAQTGAIYASVSVPGYDPNTVREDYAKLLEDPRRPLINKVTQGLYPPGSIMKPVVALGGLMDNVLTPGTEFVCTGFETLGRHRYRCLHHHGHIAMVESIERSCNVYYYNAGKALGGKRLYHWYFRLGLGHRTGIDLAGESPGILPDEARTGYRWSTGNTYHLAIGQGPMAVTPLQMAVAYAAIANGGRVVRPHLRLDPMLEAPMAEVALDTRALEVVRQGMYDVVQGAHGTARKCRLPGIEIAGKTGSAEHKRGRPTHGWFACYAPFEKPEVVCVVVVPEGGHGGSSAAPIVREVLRLYFDVIEPEGPVAEEEAVG